MKRKEQATIKTFKDISYREKSKKKEFYYVTKLDRVMFSGKFSNKIIRDISISIALFFKTLKKRQQKKVGQRKSK